MSKVLLTDEEKKELDWGTEYMSDYDTAICKTQAIKVLQVMDGLLGQGVFGLYLREYVQQQLAELEGEEVS